MINIASYISSRSLSIFTGIALSLLLAFSCMGAGLSCAYAEVRTTDVVYGETIDARGMSVSDAPSIDAEYIIVVDSEGTVYFERDATTATQIASLTKIMTAVVALEAIESGIVSFDTVVTVSSDAASVGQSSAGLQEGDTMDLESALTALMVPSGNDAAIAIAEAVGAAYLADDSSLGDSGYDVFIDKMNEMATTLGCSDTVFDNPHGLDYDEYSGDAHSTAADLALIVDYAMQNETFREDVATEDTTITIERSGEDVEIELETTDEFPSYSDYAIGVKTGYTSLAGPSFAAATSDGELELYAIVLSSSSEAQRFQDAATLTDWVYEHIQTYSLINSTETVSVDGETVPVVAEVAHEGWTNVTIKATIEDPDATVEIFDLNGNVSQSLEFYEITGNVSVGDVVGTITFKQRNSVIATYDLIACEDVEAPGFIASVGIWWERLFNSFSGADLVAQSVTVNETPLVVDKTAE